MTSVDGFNQVVTSAPVVNAMSIDVEDYFQVSAFENHIDPENWPKLVCRIEANMDRILSLLAESDTRATFFVLGWIAERYPQIVRDIIGGGHELASHGYNHQRVSNLKPTDFKQDITKTKTLLEDIGGVAVDGYRAPSYSIGEQELWAHDVLADAGYRYSSSIYPIAHDHYGIPSASRFTYAPIESNGFLEIPITTVDFMGKRWPAGGGGYFRLFPYAISQRMVKRVNTNDGRSCIFYFHPWEIDPGQPCQKGVGLKTKFRHYVNLHRMEAKLKHLLRDFHWDRVDRVFLQEGS